MLVLARILWIKFKFSRVKVCVGMGYGPNEGIGGERERFWNDMDRVGNGYRLCVLGDLNGWIGDRVKAVITGAFGFQRENENGRRVLCCERRRQVDDVSKGEVVKELRQM